MGLFSDSRVVGSHPGYTGLDPFPGPVSDEILSRRGVHWQRRVLGLVSVVPEASGAGALVENSLNRIVFRVGGVSESDAQTLESYLDTFPIGRAGMLIWYVGECFPVFKFVEDDLKWDVLSPVEFNPPKRDTPAKMRDENGKWVEMPADMRWFRTWKPDPAIRYRPWSVHRALIDLLESMYLHQHADTAVAMSRLAGAGILWWPSNLPRMGLRDGVPEIGSQEELQMMLQEAMKQSIADRGKDEAFVPLVVFADPSGGDEQAPKHVLLERPDDAAAYKQRMEAYRGRYATSVELPVESVQGMGPANHWTAWVVKEDKWRFYLSPLAELLSVSLTNNVIKPIAEKLGIEGNPYVIADGEALIAKPDKTDAAIRMFQLGGLSNEAALEATGFAAEDKPDEDERAKMLETRKASPRVQELPVESRDTRPLG